jgi:hypothetical protein
MLGGRAKVKQKIQGGRAKVKKKKSRWSSK